METHLPELGRFAEPALLILVSLGEGPKRAIDLFGALFARPIDSKGELLGMATGESLAHLNYLVARGEVQRFEDGDGVQRYRLIA